MSSQITWLDFSEKERKKMIEVVQLFREQDTRDELGIASVRDVLAELLFPGTGTLQTRARYFLFVPWLFMRREKKQNAGNKARDLLQNDEIWLMDTLVSKEEDGVIGQRSRASLHRFPSSIYWNGLRTWGTLNFSGSTGQYYQSLEYFYSRQREYRQLDKDSPTLDNPPSNWDNEIPDSPDGFPGDVNFSLTSAEGNYLKDRIQLSCPRSMLAYLVRETDPVEGIGFPWHHPDTLSFPHHLQELLSDAQNFSETFWGAALLYNLMLAIKAGMDDLVDDYQKDLYQWQEIMQTRWAKFQQWDTDIFWKRLNLAGNIPISTQSFANAWLNLVLNQPQAPDLINHASAHEMIRDREFRLKRGRSRFENSRRLEMWGGRSGAAQLNFRWRIGNQIANDILNGIAKGE
jgi:hypothetical protein